MNIFKCPFVHKEKSVPLHLSPKTPAVDRKEPLTLLEEKVITRGITGNKRGC
jgi:hypothetical protein